MPNTAVAWWLAVLLSLAAQITFSVEPHLLAGQVVGMVDSDMLVMEVSDARYRVRLAGIGALERNQPWRETATRELRRILGGRAVVIEWNKRDRWQCYFGVIKLYDENINLHMIDRGITWHFWRYEAE